jgi:spore germination protein KC
LKRIVLTFFTLLLCSGCWDKSELEEQSYVVVIGLDKADEKGNVIVTFQIANPQVGSVQKGGGVREAASEIVTFTATDLLTAREIANAFVARDISYNHTRTLIVSEKLAKDDEFIRIIYSALRERQLKRDINLIVSKEKASEFIRNNNPTTETRPHKYFQFMIKQVTDMGFSPPSKLHRYFVMTEGDGDLFLAVYATTKSGNGSGENEDEYLAGEINKQGGNPTQIMGSAVFREGVMIGTLTAEETRLSYLLDLTTDVQTMLVTYEDPKKPEYRVAARLMKEEETTIKMDLTNKEPKIDVTVPFSLELLAIPSLVDYVNNLDNQKMLIRSIEETLQVKSEEYITRMQKEYKGQPFYWSLLARQKFLTLPAYKKYDWMKTYPNAKVNVNVEIEITEFGEEWKTPDIMKIKD